MKKYKTVLTIAGSDPAGGAGIIADLKTFFAYKCYGMSVLTVLTAQNTLGVQDIHPAPADFVAKQLDSVLSDITPDAIKIGMVLNAEIIKVIADKLAQYKCNNIILDPVMVASSGDQLLDNQAITTLKTNLVPLADLITPNLYEAYILADPTYSKTELADFIQDLGAKHVLIKGGHDEGKECIDLLKIGDKYITTTFPKIATKNNHGTGCTLSAAIAANLALGFDLQNSYKNARNFLQKAIESGAQYQIGHGRGPVNHFA